MIKRKDMSGWWEKKPNHFKIGFLFGCSVIGTIFILMIVSMILGW